MTINRETNFYPLLILLLITGFLIFSIWSAFQAAGLGSEVADDEYYSKGLKYTATQVEKRAAHTLGWNIETRLNGRALEFRLTDRVRGKVDKANGTLFMAIPGRAENLRLPLQEISPGRYRVVLDGKIIGTVQARLEFEREGARINRQLLLNLG